MPLFTWYFFYPKNWKKEVGDATEGIIKYLLIVFVYASTSIGTLVSESGNMPIL